MPIVSEQALENYYNTLNSLKNTQNVNTEGNLRRAFGKLLTDIARPKKWELVEEDPQKLDNRTIYYDGVLRDEWKLPHGWWEAKDGKDNLDKEIRAKRDKGYRFQNIVFEDTHTLVLFQDGQEVGRTAITEREKFVRLLEQFLNYEIAPFENFNQAIAYFQNEIPQIANGLKQRIDEAHKSNKIFQGAFGAFMALCQQALNPNISPLAVDEMLIQHILTERLMRKLFDEDFVQHNVIAREVEGVIAALTSQSFNRKQFLGSLDRFYSVIEEAAEALASFSDKQAFINTVYERFFQGYSIKTADTHGIVYTPQPIVDFMCASVEEVLRDEFGLALGQEGVNILDPATGTGNFIVNLLQRVSPKYLDDFYKHQLFANEVMLMPYYIASLNIEATYFQRRGQRQAFEGMCFVDTLDLQVGLHTKDMFAPANTQRVTRQQAAPITVVIGNPPYNVGQVNENDNNKNRTYKNLDAKIKSTYAKDSKATNKMALYDMYLRFFRWAIDRLGDNDGMVCYVTNNSFVDQLTFDGFRKHLLQDFTRVYHLDLHGNVRQNPKLSGTTHNVFGIQVGVGITVAIRNRKGQKTTPPLAPTPLREEGNANDAQKSPSTMQWGQGDLGDGGSNGTLFYHRVPEFWTASEKLAFLAHHVELQGKQNALNTIPWQILAPDSKYTWLVSQNADIWATYVPIGNKEGKAVKGREPETIFRTYSGDVKTNRDDVVYDFDKHSLEQRVKQFIEDYNAEVYRYRRSDKKTSVDDFVSLKLKWDSTLKIDLRKGHYASFGTSNLRNSLYRPFTRQHLYFDRMLNNSVHRLPYFFPTPATEQENCVICVSGIGSNKPFMALMCNVIPCLDILEKTQCFPFYTYDPDGTNRRENITDWALAQFQTHYQDTSITKWDIFYYVYAVLHYPQYRAKFAQDLKKELPRVPYLDAKSNRTPPLAPTPLREEGKSPSTMQWGQGDLGDGGSFTQWGQGGFFHFSHLGKQLADLHLHYETAPRANLLWQSGDQINYRVEKMKRVGNSIRYNDSLTLANIPSQAWDYKLGNRSALEWLIDQYQVATDKRSGITSDPNMYSDDEQYIVKLIERVTHISTETMRIIGEMGEF
jgi:predicted helicase